MYNYTFDELLLDDSLFVNGDKLLAGNMDMGTFSRPVGEKKRFKNKKEKHIVHSGMMALCFALPQTQITHFDNNVSHTYSIRHVAEITEWAMSATTPNVAELLMPQLQAEAIIFDFPQDLHFIGDEPDFMHLMAVREFSIKARITIEEGKPDFDETEVLDFIDEPFPI